MSTRPGSFRRSMLGFTLVEAIVVIVLTGILAGMVAVFIRAPIKAYFDVVNRAELTDVADTALRRAARDIRSALPNSVRIAGTCNGISTCYLEFVPIKSAGRYRESGPGDPLDFSAAADTFDVLGPGVNIAAGDSIVIYNLGITGSDVYAGTDRRGATTTGTGLATAGYNGGAFPLSSPARRFHVVGTPVSYVCNAGAGQLQRYAGYAFPVSPFTQPQPPAGTPALLATNVSRCLFTYQTLNQLNAMVTLELGLTKGGETVSLINQIHVNNVP